MANSTATEMTTETGLNDTALMTLEPKLVSQVMALADIQENLFHDVVATKNKNFVRAVLMATAYRQMKAAVGPELRETFLIGRGKAWGWTDDGGRKVKKNGDWVFKPYTDDELIDALLHGALMGFSPSENEINVIAGKPYITKEGYRRVLGELGVFLLEKNIGAPERKGDVCYVSIKAKWEYQGKVMSTSMTKQADGDWRVPIKWFPGNTDDTIKGKAEARLFKEIYFMCTGFSGNSMEAEADMIDGEIVQPKKQQQAVTYNPSSKAEEPASEPKPTRRALTEDEVIEAIKERLAERLAEADSLTACKKIFFEASNYAQANLEGDKLIGVIDMIQFECDAKADEIRGSRGENSSGE